MMKKTKTVTIVLAIILISLIAFVGIYVKKQNRMENIVKDYNYGMNLKGSRVVSLDLNTDETVTIKDTEGNVIEEELTDEQIQENGYTKEVVKTNPDEARTIENYNECKKIIENRLKEFGASEYLIRLNKELGTITIEIPEDENTDYIVSNIGQSGEFEIIDSETNEVLMDNSDLKNVQVLYGSSSEQSNSIDVYISFNFTKDGSKKFEDITNKYVKIETSETETTENDTEESVDGEENVDNNEQTDTEEAEVQEKTITVRISGTDAITTSFEDPITNGVMQLSMGSATSDQETLNENIKNATTVATIINSGNVPLEYETLGNEYIKENTETKTYLFIFVAAVTLIFVAILLIKYRMLGLLCGICSIGLLAILSLVIRYTNIIINIETIIGAIIILLLNFMLLLKMLEKTKNSDDLKIGLNRTIGKFFIKIIPICIFAIIFSFISWNPLSNLGLTMFWGLVLIAL